MQNVGLILNHVGVVLCLAATVMADSKLWRFVNCSLVALNAFFVGSTLTQMFPVVGN